MDVDCFAELTLCFKARGGRDFLDSAEFVFRPYVSIFKSPFGLIGIGGRYLADLSLPTGPVILALILVESAPRLPYECALDNPDILLDSLLK